MINGQSGGGAGPKLVFLHGGSGRWQLGAELFSHLPVTVRWWGADLPGHGDSAWTGRYGLEDAADELAAWAAANLDGSAWWYGHSYGGQVALALAGRHPDVVGGLVMGDTPLSLARMLELFKHTGARMRRWQEWSGSAPMALTVDRQGGSGGAIRGCSRHPSGTRPTCTGRCGGRGPSV